MIDLAIRRDRTADLLVATLLQPQRTRGASMADVVDQARKAIETRLRELEDEARRLRDALTSLGGRKPATRQQQFLAAVKKNPGAPVSEIAKDIGVSPKQLYPVARRLREKGEIRKRGKGYAVKS
jgi:CRP-like cAMP-binding protein